MTTERYRSGEEVLTKAARLDALQRRLAAAEREEHLQRDEAQEAVKPTHSHVPGSPGLLPWSDSEATPWADVRDRATRTHPVGSRSVEDVLNTVLDTENLRWRRIQEAWNTCKAAGYDQEDIADILYTLVEEMMGKPPDS